MERLKNKQEVINNKFLNHLAKRKQEKQEIRQIYRISWKNPIKRTEKVRKIVLQKERKKKKRVNKFKIKDKNISNIFPFDISNIPSLQPFHHIRVHYLSSLSIILKVHYHSSLSSIYEYNISLASPSYTSPLSLQPLHHIRVHYFYSLSIIYKYIISVASPS